MMIQQIDFSRMKYILAMLFGIAYAAYGQNQTEEDNTYPGPVDKELIGSHSSAVVSQEELDIRNYKRLKINYYTGTNFILSNQFGSASSLYFAAVATYPVTPRFTLEFGTKADFSRFSGIPSGLYPEYPVSEQNLYTAGITLFARGSYYLSSRLTLSGTAFRQLSPHEYPAVNPRFMNRNRDGMSFELNYRLFENLQIGAQFNIIRNDGPFYPYHLRQPAFDNHYW